MFFWLQVNLLSHFFLKKRRACFFSFSMSELKGAVCRIGRMEAFFAVDESTRKREREKARQLRNSQWWTNQKGRGLCYYCQSSIKPSQLTMDHKTPIARGGRSTRNNLVPCCKACNTEKQHLTLSEWIAKREAEGNPLACAKLELY